ncbi:MAG: hypothetical protein DRI44_00710 [Chlamydiae bacterium]|nr:MAG: hypothetical protein DRI44_00710 [Chlamydiota bacterium]
MKSLVFKTGCLLFTFIGIVLFTGCSTFTYETQSWRIAETSGSSAEVIVRYVGIGATSKNIEKRAEKAKELVKIASEKNTDDPITPKLQNVHRKVFLQDGKVVIEETGTIRNPLSWFEQTGLNFFNWFYDPIDLSLSGKYIVKSGWNDSNILLATNGRVIDEDTFASSRLRLDTPLAIGGDTQWFRDVPRGESDLIERDKHQVIVWPQASRIFYWKLSGPAFKKSWQSLAHEFSALMKASENNVNSTQDVNEIKEKK